MLSELSLWWTHPQTPPVFTANILNELYDAEDVGGLFFKGPRFQACISCREQQPSTSHFPEYLFSQEKRIAAAPTIHWISSGVMGVRRCRLELSNKRPSTSWKIWKHNCELRLNLLRFHGHRFWDIRFTFRNKSHTCSSEPITTNL